MGHYFACIFQLKQDLGSLEVFSAEKGPLQPPLEGGVYPEGGDLNAGIGMTPDDKFSLVRKLSDNPVKIMNEAMTFLRGRKPTV